MEKEYVEKKIDRTSPLQVSLSILLPSYNNDCRPLLKSISRQASALVGSLLYRPRCTGQPYVAFIYEVIVYDDCSTLQETANLNRKLCDELPNCKFVSGTSNVGRSVARNRLVKEAKYEWLLFIDSDLLPVSDDFISAYVKVLLSMYTATDEAVVRRKATTQAFVGGLAVCADNSDTEISNLRFAYEKRAIKQHNCSWRRVNPYSAFHVSNLLIMRDVMLSHPFDSTLQRYGYEDVLLGKELQKDGIIVEHIDNPVAFSHFDENASFVAKTEEGLQTLHSLSAKMRGYSGIQTFVERLSAFGLVPLLRFAFQLTGGMMRRNLQGKRPSLKIFDLYRIGYYASLK